MGIVRASLATLAMLSGTAASAQTAFTGPHVGASATAVDHHFIIEETELPSGAARRFNVTQWGLGGQAFAGYDLAIAPRVILGVEGAFDFGGRTAIERNDFYAMGIDPRHGFSATARVGFVVTPRLMLYAGGGYGGHDYRVINTVPAVGEGDLPQTRSFVLRGGGELMLTRRVALRAEFEHLDGTRNSFILGIPIRF